MNTSDTDKFVLNLQRVLYVPKLTKNLQSVPAMATMGAEVRFDSGRCIVLKDGKVFIIGTLYDKKLYKANVEHAAVAHAQLPNSETWHCRFGHLNHDYLNRMKKNEMVHGMDYTAAGNDKDCEACILGKMQKKRFPKHENKGKDTKHFEDKRRATRPFEIVHTDGCGPMQVESKGGSCYMLTFTDDYSRYAMVHFIRYKSEVLSKFKDYASYVEKQFGHAVKVLSYEKHFGYEVKILRSDNGGEYTLLNLLSFVMRKELDGSTLHHTHRNRMELQSG